ncbi:MAG: ATP-dependent helicase [bacterium]|nr:ATP-dependent helicase [bacterium]
MIIKLLNNSDKNLFVGLAGPGTGKSHTFKTIINSGEFKGKKILILSFINKLVNDLEREFDDFDNVRVSTLHSFALQKYKNLFRETTIELEQDLDGLISEDYFYINKEKISYEARLCEGNLDKEEEEFYLGRAEFYSNEGKLYSFNSIIHAVNSIFSNNNDKIPDEYDLILVDEFQDFNQLEYNLIKLLNKKNKVILVGDDDQSLYDWKHARPELIRALYNHEGTGEFSLDFCYRCTQVVVDAVNSLISNAKSDGYLQDRADEKKFLYPTERTDDKNEISAKHSCIDFVSGVSGHQLIYQLATRIRKEVEEHNGGRVLVLVPSFLKQSIYEGLSGEGFNVVEFELFGNEGRNKIKHKYLIEAFKTLAIRKTDNLMLRKIIPLYLSDSEIRKLIINCDNLQKKIWYVLDGETKVRIEQDIALFKKAKQGKTELTADELKRFSEIFNLKNLISKMIKGFAPNTRGAIEVEMTTVMSSKGLSADFVYYIGVDDYIMLDKETGELTDQKICEFLVGITRAKKKLTLFSANEGEPVILKFIDSKFVRRSKTK